MQIKENQSFAFIRTDKKMVKLFFDDITLVKGLGNYVEIYTRLNKKYIYYKSLKDLIDNLPNQFMRIHNSYIINLSNMEYFEDNHVIIQDMKLTVAKSYRDCFMSTLNTMML